MKPGMNTLCVHSGTYHDEATGGVVTPLFASTAFAHPHPSGKTLYPRYFNVPSQESVCRKLADLENGEKALVLGSGMAAISTALLAFLQPGDHVIFPRDLYGGTHHFALGCLARLGIAVTFTGTSAADIEASLRPATKVIYLESPSNPLLKVTDLQAVAALARSRRILTAIDNTFATPVNQTPLDAGIDMVLHSGTKYLNGHSDVNCGAVVTSAELMKPILDSAIIHGGTLDVRGCYLLERGLKTLALRVRQQNESALALARFLEEDGRVGKVHYPGLPSHAGHALAGRQMRGFGGMLSFELAPGASAAEFLKRLRLITPAVSLGGVESLITLPAQTSHAGLDPAERADLGIGDDLLRLSVGIEDVEDLRKDLEGALGI